jgi:hypothetical protein
LCTSGVGPAASFLEPHWADGVAVEKLQRALGGEDGDFQVTAVEGDNGGLKITVSMQRGLKRVRVVSATRANRVGFRLSTPEARA